MHRSVCRRLRLASHVQGLPFDQPHPADGPPAPLPPQPVTEVGTAVAVLDSGICRHPWLNGRYDPGCLPDEAELWDLSAAELPRHVGHGTFVAGIVRHRSPSSMIVPRRVIHLDGESDDETLAAAIRKLGDIDVLNLSLGAAPHPSTRFHSGVELTEEAIWELQHRHGTIVVLAAGNDREDFPQDRIAPDDPLTVVVGALDKDDQPAPFSDTRGVTIWAPGVDVLSSFVYWAGPVAAHGAEDDLDPAGTGQARSAAARAQELPHSDGTHVPTTNRSRPFTGWASWTGTSFAAPAVAGAIAAEIGRLGQIGEPRKRRAEGLERVLASARQIIVEPHHTHIKAL